MLKVTKENVLRELKRTYAGKAAGPDRIKLGLLKTCAEQLCSILCVIFLSARSLLCGKPLPIPKKTTVKAMSDLRPVALTSAVMKVFERVVLSQLQRLVADFLGPLQFAYRRERGVEDAVLHVLQPCSYIRLMLLDFSSAFSIIQPRLLAEKLLKMKVSIPTILWVLDYLTDRPRFVKSGSELTDIMLTNTGAQGTVLSPFLFSLYSADCRSSHDSCPTDKFADDTGLIMNDDDSHYRQEVDRFVDWCEKNYLVMNVGKTKEMIIEFRRN